MCVCLFVYLCLGAQAGRSARRVCPRVHAGMCTCTRACDSHVRRRSCARARGGGGWVWGLGLGVGGGEGWEAHTVREEGAVVAQAGAHDGAGGGEHLGHPRAPLGALVPDHDHLRSGF